MAKKKRGHKMPFWRKAARFAVGILGTVIGIGVATMPAHPGIKAAASGDVEGGFANIAYEFGGVTATGQIDFSKVLRTAIVVGVGIGIMAAFRHLARRI